jgi:hypothetical protein
VFLFSWDDSDKFAAIICAVVELGILWLICHFVF